jgi:hypothetical protein
MKHPFPHNMQAAMNLTNKSPEAVERVNQWVESHGGSVEHLSYEQVKTEVLPLLKKDNG